MDFSVAEVNDPTAVVDAKRNAVARRCTCRRSRSAPQAGPASDLYSLGVVM